MRVLGHLIGKELRLLTRDWHALALLFLMPTAFILVMSLALQNQFSERSSVHIRYALVDQGSANAHADLTRHLASLRGFERQPMTATLDAAKARVREGTTQFLVVIPAGFDGSAKAPLQVYAAADTGAAVYRLFEASVNEAVARSRFAGLGLFPAPASSASGSTASDSAVAMHTLYANGRAGKLPNSVQQSVPAWLLFAMFFIALPLSTTWLHERQQGTYARLRSLGLSAPMLLLGKLVPYLLLNLAQVVLMLLVGMYVVPWCGGEALSLGSSWAALALISTASSLAAIGYGLLVANLVSSSEQATLFTGVANLLMAAVGGIMVPRFIMPHALQVLSDYSPMAWGLDGFLDVLLRGGGVTQSLPAVLKLGGFAVTCLALAAASMQWRKSR